MKTKISTTPTPKEKKKAIMHFHWQNLKKEDGTSHLLHGRAWLSFGGDKNQTIINPEWSVPSRRLSVGLDLNYYGDTAIGLGLSLWLFSLHISIENRWLYRKLEKITKRKDQSYTNGRCIGLSIHSGSLWVNIWEDPMESRSKDPWWWHFTINPMDKIFGRQKCERFVLESGEKRIDMPEGTYEATYKIEKMVWKRPRLPFTKQQEIISFDIPVGIPHEGKGENSWDCGMDATFGSSFTYSGNVHNDARKLAISCLQARQEYGSLNSSDYLKWKVEGEKKLSLPDKKG